MFNASNPLVHSLTPPLKLSSNLFFISVPKPSNLCTRALKPATANFSLSYSPESLSNQLSLAHSLQSETLEILEWASVCKQLSALAFTAMGFSAAQEAHIPVGRSKEESQKLLDQTTAAVDAITMAGSPPSDFSAIENVSGIVSSAVSGKLLSINELCAVRRTLNAAKGLFEKLKGLAFSADCTDSGTDPSEGVALSASILLYLKGRVNLAVVTTHYADLSRLKEKDNQFENAAMEFCLETLQPTYRILWGSTGDSNALSIAKLIGFNQRIIERAQKWVERLMPEKQQERKGLLYRSLIEERGRLEAQAKMAASLHSDIMDLYREIQDEAEDLDKRKRALVAKETLQVQKEVKTAKSQMESVLNEFDNQLKTAGADQLNLLIRKSEAAIASVIKAHCPDDDLLVSETSTASYTPQPGEQVHLKRLGDKLATVVETPGDDGTVLVQYGKIKVRLKKNDIRAVPSIEKNPMTNSAPRLKQQASQSRTGETESREVTYGPVIQTSKNTVDLRGMRVEEASDLLDMVISARQSQSVLFVIHGMGTGVVKERALEILKNHPRVAKYEQESTMNYGCTVAYIK